MLVKARFIAKTPIIKKSRQGIALRCLNRYSILSIIVLMSLVYQNLNENQRQAVDCQNGPLLIVAGAGSGKTRTLTSRLMFLLNSGIPAEKIIAITFTNKAADEMVNRVKSQMANSGGPFIGTFHSLGARILKKEAKFLGRSPNFSIFDNDDSLKLIKNIAKNFNLTEKEKRKISPAFLQKDFSRIKNEMSDSENEEEIVKYFFNQYELELQRNNAFDFEDLIEKPVSLFLKNRETLEKYQNQHQYILVDEFQDTNPAQYQFIKLLAQKHKNLSVVGDDAQSIYKFRGSDFRNFLDFEKDWPDTKIVLLEQNYRSTANIINAASALIKNNKFQKSKNLWTENPEGDKIKLIEHEDAFSEADYIAEEILSRRIFGKENSTAVLYRTNAQSRAIETALIERGIGYFIFGGVKFYERKEIKDIVAALRFASNPNDSVSLQRLQKNFLKKTFLRLKNELPHQVGKLSASQLISYVLEISGYFNELKKDYANFTERIENLNELIYFASNFSSLSEFLERVSLMQSTDNIKNNKDSRKSNINLMTVHLAKGLEFDNVFIAGCNEGVLPHQMSYFSEEEIEEERRLMYVAMTRARQKLYLNFYHLPSRFLSEIPAEFLEFSVSKSIDDEERYIEY